MLFTLSRRFCLWLTTGALLLSFSLLVSRRCLAEPAKPAPFAGKFADDKISIDLSEDHGSYAGTITQSGKAFPAKAIVNGQTLTGTFVASDHEFPFSATFADGKFILESGGKSHALTKVVVNPLNQLTASPQPLPIASAEDAPIADGQSFAGFTVLASTQAGKTLFIKLPSAVTLEAAMTQTADELARGLDAKPSLGSAFADAKSKNKGGVSFTAKLKGRDMHGVIFCSTDEKSSTATVILADALAKREDVVPLYAAMPSAGVKMQTHVFPDKSGSIDLPEGWTTPSTSAEHGVTALGPAGQAVVFGNIIPINDPDCRLVRLSRQNYQSSVNLYNMGMKTYQQSLLMHQRFPNTPMPMKPQEPVPPNPDPNVQYPAIVFCPYCDGPAEVLKTLYPLLAEKQKRVGGRFSTLEKVIELFPIDEANPLQPKSKSGLAYIAVDDHDGDNVKHMRALVRISTAPVVEGEVWQAAFCVMRASDETFDRDLPVMNQIMNSVKLDMNVIGKENQAETDAALKFGQQVFEQIQKNGRDFQDQQTIQFNNHERQIAAQEKARHDSNSDFIEYIGGVRSVYDRGTGKMLDVDLFNSNAITNGLNAAANDPNRFVQIPLRYQR